MTRMLASVTCTTEAKTVMEAGVDIVDIKDPKQGALGAVDTSVVTDIVQLSGGHFLTSATIGDLPMQTGLLSRAIQEMSETGVDIVKVGLFAEHLAREILSVIKRQVDRGIDIVLVCFADREFLNLDFNALREAGLLGVMLDTADKSRGSLRKRVTQQDLEQFIHRARRAELMVGLAGSLRREDIPSLRDLEPDYLGFRGALCRDNIRERAVDFRAVKQIRSMITTELAGTAEISVKSGG